MAFVSGRSFAQPAEPPRAAAATTPDGAKKPETKGQLTVAVLDFGAETADSAALGKQVAEIVIDKLGQVDGLRLVDRSSFAETLKEQDLNLTGLIRPKDATKFGRIVGAKLLVTGKAFALDDQLFITAKIIGTETTLVEGVLVKGEKGADFLKLADQLGDKLAVRLREAGPKLVAGDEDEDDPLPALKEKLAKLRKPVLFVRVAEQHLAPRQAAAAAPPVGGDPAAETELRKWLRAGGFTIIDGGEREQIEGGVEVVVSGDAFSEFAARIGNLVSCSARVELKLSDRKTGAVLFVDRETTRAADLSENIAGKSALEQAGRALAVRLLQHFADTLKPAEAPKPQ
jgi:TolB-like protein